MSIFDNKRTFKQEMMRYIDLDVFDKYFVNSQKALLVVENIYNTVAIGGKNGNPNIVETTNFRAYKSMIDDAVSDNNIIPASSNYTDEKMYELQKKGEYKFRIKEISLLTNKYVMVVEYDYYVENPSAPSNLKKFMNETDNCLKVGIFPIESVKLSNSLKVALNNYNKRLKSGEYEYDDEAKSNLKSMVAQSYKSALNVLPDVIRAFGMYSKKTELYYAPCDYEIGNYTVTSLKVDYNDDVFVNVNLENEVELLSWNDRGTKGKIHSKKGQINIELDSDTQYDIIKMICGIK